MLPSIFEALGTAMAGLVDACINAFLATLDLDLATFTATFPLLKTVYTVIRDFSIGLAIIIAGIAVAKYASGAIQSSRLNDTIPGILFRTMASGLMIFWGGNILDYIVELGKVPYGTFLNMSAAEGASGLKLAVGGVGNFIVGLAGELALGGFAIAVSLIVAVLQVFLAILIGWNLFKLVLEVCERWLMVGVLVYMSPLAFATIPSSDTVGIFKRFMSMFVGSVMQMSLSVIFLKLVVSGFYATGGPLGEHPYVVKLLLILAMCKIAQRVDSYLQQLGVGVATTGGSLLDDIVASAKTLSSFGGKGGGGGANGAGGGGGSILGAGGLTGALMSGAKAAAGSTAAAKAAKAGIDAIGKNKPPKDIAAEMAAAVGIGGKGKNAQGAAAGQQHAGKKVGNAQGATAGGTTAQNGGANAQKSGTATGAKGQATATSQNGAAIGAGKNGKPEGEATGTEGKAGVVAPDGAPGANTDGADGKNAADQAGANAPHTPDAAEAGAIEAAGAVGMGNGGKPEGADAEGADGANGVNEANGAVPGAEGVDAEGNPIGMAGTAGAEAGMVADAESEKEQAAEAGNVNPDGTQAGGEFSPTSEQVGVMDANGNFRPVESDGEGGWRDAETKEPVSANDLVSQGTGYEALRQNADGTYTDSSGREFSAANGTYTDQNGNTAQLPDGAHVSQGGVGQPPAGTMVDGEGKPIIGEGGKAITQSDVTPGAITAADGTAAVAGYTGADGAMHALPAGATRTESGTYVDANNTPITGVGGKAITDSDIKPMVSSTQTASIAGAASSGPAGSTSVSTNASGAIVNSSGSPIENSGRSYGSGGGSVQAAAVGSGTPGGAGGIGSGSSAAAPVHVSGGSAPTVETVSGVGAPGGAGGIGGGSSAAAPVHVSGGGPSQSGGSISGGGGSATAPAASGGQRVAASGGGGAVSGGGGAASGGAAEPRPAGSGISAQIPSSDVAAFTAGAVVGSGFGGGGSGGSSAALDSVRATGGHSSDYGGAYAEPQAAYSAPAQAAGTPPPSSGPSGSGSQSSFQPNTPVSSHTPEGSSNSGGYRDSWARREYNGGGAGGYSQETYQSPGGSGGSDSGKSWVEQNFPFVGRMMQNEAVASAVSSYMATYKEVGRAMSPLYNKRCCVAANEEWDPGIAEYKYGVNSRTAAARTERYSHDSSPMPDSVVTAVESGKSDRFSQRQYNDNFTSYGCGNGRYENDIFAGTGGNGDPQLSTEARAAGLSMKQIDNPRGGTDYVVTDSGDGRASESWLAAGFRGDNFAKMSAGTADTIGERDVYAATLDNASISTLTGALNVPLKEGETISGPALTAAVEKVFGDVIHREPGVELLGVSMSGMPGRADDGMGHSLVGGNSITYTYKTQDGEVWQSSIWNDLTMSSINSVSLDDGKASFKAADGTMWCIDGDKNIEAVPQGRQTSTDRGMFDLMSIAKGIKKLRQR